MINSIWPPLNGYTFSTVFEIPKDFYLNEEGLVPKPEQDDSQMSEFKFSLFEFRSEDWEINVQLKLSGKHLILQIPE